MSENPKKLSIHFEFCSKCSEHSWFLVHDQSRFEALFQKRKVSLSIPGFTLFSRVVLSLLVRASLLLKFKNRLAISKNVPPPNLIPARSFSQNQYWDKLNKCVVTFPRVDAFEITCCDREIELYSKLSLKRFPNENFLLALIEHVLAILDSGQDFKGTLASVLDELYRNSKKRRPNSPETKKTLEKKRTQSLEQSKETPKDEKGESKRPNTSPKQESKANRTFSRPNSTEGTRFIVRKMHSQKHEGSLVKDKSKENGSKSKGSSVRKESSNKKVQRNNAWVRKNWKKKEIELFQTLMQRYGIQQNEKNRENKLKGLLKSESQKLIEAYEGPNGGRIDATNQFKSNTFVQETRNQKSKPEENEMVPFKRIIGIEEQQMLKGHRRILQSPLNKLAGSFGKANNNHKRGMVWVQRKQGRNAKGKSKEGSKNKENGGVKEREDVGNRKRIIGSERMPQISLSLVEVIDAQIEKEEEMSQNNKENESNGVEETNEDDETNQAKGKEMGQKMRGTSGEIGGADESHPGEEDRPQSEHGRVEEKEKGSERMHEGEKSDEEPVENDGRNQENEGLCQCNHQMPNKIRENAGKEETRSREGIDKEKPTEEEHPKERNDMKLKPNEPGREKELDQDEEKIKGDFEETKEEEPNQREEAVSDFLNERAIGESLEQDEESSDELSGEAGELMKEFEKNLDLLTPERYLKKAESDSPRSNRQSNRSGCETPQFKSNGNQDLNDEGNEESEEESDGKCIEAELLNEELHGEEISCLEEEQERENYRENKSQKSQETQGNKEDEERDEEEEENTKRKAETHVRNEEKESDAKEKESNEADSRRNQDETEKNAECSEREEEEKDEGENEEEEAENNRVWERNEEGREESNGEDSENNKGITEREEESKENNGEVVFQNAFKKERDESENDGEYEQNENDNEDYGESYERNEEEEDNRENIESENGDQIQSSQAQNDKETHSVNGESKNDERESYGQNDEEFEDEEVNIEDSDDEETRKKEKEKEDDDDQYDAKYDEEDKYDGEDPDFEE